MIGSFVVAANVVAGYFARSWKTNSTPVKINTRFSHNQLQDTQLLIRSKGSVMQTTEHHKIRNHSQKTTTRQLFGIQLLTGLRLYQIPMGSNLLIWKSSKWKISNQESNIPSQQKNYTNLIQNHALQEHSHWKKEDCDKTSKLNILHLRQIYQKNVKKNYKNVRKRMKIK